MKRSRRALAARAAAILVGATLCVFVVGRGFLVAFDWRFHPTPAPTKLPPPADRADAAHQDLEALAQLVRLDRSFTAESAQRFEAERTKLIASANDLSRQAFEMQVSRLVALAGNGHTTVGRRLRRLNRVPIRVAWFAEGLFVVRAMEPFEDLVGSQVLSIDGKAPGDVLTALTPYLSGTADHAKSISPLILESPDALNGMWPAMSADSATYVLRKASGALVTVSLEGIAPGLQSSSVAPTRDLAPQHEMNETGAWHGVLSRRTDLPSVLRDPDASVFVQRLDHGDGLYVHIATVEGDERGAIADQLANVLDPIMPGSLRYAILDLRFNGGGDYLQTLRFTRELPKRIAGDGMLFILTDHATFSAALVTAARAKYFARDRVTILGEQVGDREQFWAESGPPLELPNSRISVYFATGYHDWARGCRWKDLTRCFWFNIAFDVAAGDLSPNASIAWRFADYRDGVDTVMEQALRRAQQYTQKDSSWSPQAAIPTITAALLLTFR